MNSEGGTMFGQGQARIYNIVSMVFIAISILWVLFVILQLVS